MDLPEMHHIAYRCRDAGETAEFNDKTLDQAQAKLDGWSASKAG